MSEDRTSRRRFLRRLGAFAAAGIGVLGFPATAWASTYCCPATGTQCPAPPPGQKYFYCTGNCPGQPPYCDLGTWNDNICHRIGC